MKNNLRITLLAGLILFIISGAVFTFFYLYERNFFSSTRQQDSFNRILREYDAAFEGLFFTEREFDHLNAELDRLEKRAISLESWLSILKRRRALSSIHSPSLVNYHNSLNNALKVYPQSQPIIALSCASIIKNRAPNRETEEQLRQWLLYLSDSSFNNLRLSIHVILGDLNNPLRALEFPLDIYSDGTEYITVNLAILKTIHGDYRGASSDIHNLLNSGFSPTINTLNFAAEYNYDFGDLLRSAEIFSFISEELGSLDTSINVMVRQADALYLAGYTEIAAKIWNMLSFYGNENSLYNLAITSNDPQITYDYLEKLVNLETPSNSESRQFGLIRYSRFLDYASALVLLNKTKNYPYVDLEICKRHSGGQTPGRQIAEAWLLMDRHEGNEELYKWVAWLFFFQRFYDEAVILLDRLDLQQLNAPWMDIYKAVLFMNDGNLEKAENIFRSVPSNDEEWFVNANLGRILEAVRSPSRAIEQYELAGIKVNNQKTAARIQQRIARCFLALNRPLEARRALQYALDLDPENIGARLELDKNLF